MNEIQLKGLKKKDAINFGQVIKRRKKVINKSSYTPVNENYLANSLALSLHPEEQFVKVEKIITENEDVKTFVLVPDIEAGTKNLAYFKAGQYLSVCVSIGDGIYRRPYTISCSPKKSLDNMYTITIKRVSYGIVSNYFLDEVEEGDRFVVSAPTGDFCYSKIRDARHVIALAEGSGIIPFLSMAEAINDGIEDFDLTIVYSAKTKNDLLFRERLEEIKSKKENVNVLYVLSEEDDNEYIDKDIIERFMKEENSFFVKGSLSFYTYINDVLKEFNLPKKFIRHDLLAGEIKLKTGDDFRLTVLTNDEELHVECNGKETLLQALERNGINAPSKCQVGECGFCRSKLISGKVRTVDDGINGGDKDHNYIHPCITYPESDVVIKLAN